MHIDDLINELNQIKYEHGNVLVTVPEDVFSYGLEFTEKPAIEYKEDTNEVVIYYEY